MSGRGIHSCVHVPHTTSSPDGDSTPVVSSSILAGASPLHLGSWGAEVSPLPSPSEVGTWMVPEGCSTPLTAFAGLAPLQASPAHRPPSPPTTYPSASDCSESPGSPTGVANTADDVAFFARGIRLPRVTWALIRPHFPPDGSWISVQVGTALPLWGKHLGSLKSTCGMPIRTKHSMTPPSGRTNTGVLPGMLSKPNPSWRHSWHTDNNLGEPSNISAESEILVPGSENFA